MQNNLNKGDLENGYNRKNEDDDGIFFKGEVTLCKVITYSHNLLCLALFLMEVFICRYP